MKSNVDQASSSFYMLPSTAINFVGLPSSYLVATLRAECGANSIACTNFSLRQ